MPTKAKPRKTTAQKVSAAKRIVKSIKEQVTKASAMLSGITAPKAVAKRKPAKRKPAKRK